MQTPPCPITGAAPKRHVQRVSAQLLIDLWRIEYGVDVTPSFKGAEGFDLWESPTGLYYFDPLVEGDADFYAGYYKVLQRKGHYWPGSHRGFYYIVAREIGAGERVLDVGCGYGGFRELIPQADYVGLDPHFHGQSEWVRPESLEDHLKTDEGRYDVACLFDVLEHLVNPAEMMRNMARAIRPGGRVIVCLPHVPSALTRMPNFLLNAPPHHLTWWTESALEAVAAQAGLVSERIVQSPWCPISSKAYWIERFTAIKTGDKFFWHSWPVHASNLIAAGLGLAVDKIYGPPKNPTDEGAGLLMFARKPG